MTRERAAELLSEVMVLDDPEMAEAHRVAISALRQQDVPDKNVGKMTNADRIRSISDEELADFLNQWGTSTRAWQKDPGETLYWLQQPVEEDDNDRES